MNLDQPPSEDELNRLEQFLVHMETDDCEWITLSSVDGFLAAIAVGPKTIPEEIWTRRLFGEGMNVFSSSVEANAIIGVLARRLRQIVETCQRRPPTFWPILDVDTDETVLGEIWAEGFLIGMRLDFEAWRPLLEHETPNILLMPILALVDDRVLNRIEPRRKKQANLLDRMVDSIPSIPPGLLDYSQRLRETGSLDGDDPFRDAAEDFLSAKAQAPARSIKVGRNAPCPCGWGQKYKRCCGAG
jgi:uncharacterized protein